MPLPNVASALERWKVQVILKTVTTTQLDMVRTPVLTPVDIFAVVQPANQEVLKALTVDKSLKYLWVHYAGFLSEGQYIEHETINYKIVKILDFRIISTGEYGHTEVVGEEAKGELR